MADTEIASVEDAPESTDPERDMRELSAAALAIAQQRLQHDRVLVFARERIDVCRAELPVAERTAKTRRQSQLDAVRGRADLERRLQSLVESEALARTRRQQAEQRAEGFRAAATFATSGSLEAGPSDADRNEHERLVGARATREASVAASRAAEEHVEEQKIGKLRAELEMHVAAEREVEMAFALERDEAERRTAELHSEIERLADEIRDAELARQELDETASQLSRERAELAERYDDHRRSTRESINTRILELLAFEADAARERTELEAMLAEFDARDEAGRVELAAHAAAAAEEARLTADAAQASSNGATASTNGVAPAATPAPEPVKAPLYVERPKSKFAEKPKTSESFIRPERVPFHSTPAWPKKAVADEELIPGLRSLVGNIFTRKKSEPAPQPVAPENSSIADRIARDFGLLGEPPE